MSEPTSWLREPISAQLTLGWRLRLYAACGLLVAASVPFLHLYLAVDLDAGQLAVHAFDISLGTMVALGVCEAVGTLWQRGTTWQLETTPARLLVGLLGIAGAALGLQWGLRDVLPMTDEIRARHVDAGYQDMSLRVAPFVVLMVAGVAGVIREQVLRRELAQLRALSEGLVRGSDPASPEERVAFRHDGIDEQVPVDRVVRVQAEENYCRVHVWEEKGSRELLVRATLAETLAKLPADAFARVHRSHVVSLRWVRAIERAGRRLELLCDDGSRVPVSRSRSGDVRAWLGREAVS